MPEMPMRESAIAQVIAMRHELLVRAVKIVMVSLLAFAWVVLTSHCRIEAVPGFEFFRCAAEAPSSSEGGHPCDDAGCCSLESAQFHAPRQQEVAPIVVGDLQPSPTFALAAYAPPVAICLGLPTSAPPELFATWRFFTRNALPPRAPSFDS